MCTVALWANNGVATVSARNMDWLEDMHSNMWVMPRGIKRVGLTIEGENSLNWKSKYGSVVMTAYDIAAADGVNEKSLAVHILWLAESGYGERDASLPGLSISLWGQFFLDNFATVSEAVEYVQNNPFQLRTAEVGSTQRIATVHLQIEDGSGDVAIFEYIDGALKIHHDRSHKVMTNSPAYDQQIENLKKYEGFGGTESLPGTTQAADRFVRAAYYLDHLVAPKNTLEAVAGVVSVLRNVAQPFGVPDPSQPNISPTLWRTITDHTNGTYYFESTTSPYLVWLNMAKIDFSEGSPVQKLDLVNNREMIGESNSQLASAEAFAWAMPS